MVWVYERTGESLLLAMLMHGSATGSLVIFASLAPGWPLFIFTLVLAPCCGSSLERSPWPTTGISRDTRQPPLRRRVA